MAVGLVAALRQGPRRFAARTALLIAAGALGCWVRASLLPSAGSWDVDYWRTAMLEASRHGIARAYGGPDDVPTGHLAAQLRGRERVSAPGMSGHLVRLEAASLIERVRAADRRRIGLYLTAEGDKVLKSVRKKRTAWLAARLDGLEPHERKSVEAAIESLEKLIAE